MIVKLLNYAGNAVEVDVGDIETIGAMRIRIVTGDEILTVVYKDYTTKEFDSCNDRLNNWRDGKYDIYNAATGLNLFNDEAFMKRKSSYWLYDVVEEGP